MTTLTYKDGIEINQVTRQQITLRGKGDGAFAFTINKEVSLLPPSDNLRMIDNDRFIFAKQSFDQWVLIAKNKEEDQEILRMVSEINKNDAMLASNYSEGQSYFEISGEDKDHYLNKLTHFDFRDKKFPASTMVQTLVARIDCCIYKLEDKYIITCGKSFEDYLRDRLLDSVNL